MRIPIYKRKITANDETLMNISASKLAKTEMANIRIVIPSHILFSKTQKRAPSKQNLTSNEETETSAKFKQILSELQRRICKIQNKYANIFCLYF